MLSLVKRVWAGSLIVLLFAPPWSQGAEAPLRKLRVAITSLSGSMAVPWLAREAGIFKKHGLEVEVIATPSGVEGMNALDRRRGHFSPDRRCDHGERGRRRR